VSGLLENVLEQTALDWFQGMGYNTAFGPNISPDGPACEREDYDQVILLGRLQAALENINPNIPPEAIEEALRKMTLTESPNLFGYNELLVISDGLEARMGTLTSGWDRFMPWPDH